MTIDADDIDDVFNLVSAQTDEWLQSAYSAFMKGPVTRTADTVWRAQPDAIKQAAKEQIPDAAAILENLRKGRIK